ncbi:MAG: prepilin-type N-terminal cleavage/methylation domain-containing protein [Bacilli bacterium]|mgnify:CR=1 FL=1|nr:prepilin-type N-terminal cleavage/methylation domain-containing protein [Bacilli bacterium]
MKKNGFTMVELLAILVVLAILFALAVPAYSTILLDVRRDNYSSKITEIELAANKYGEKIKDDVKNKGQACYHQEISSLIKKGLLLSESDYDDIIINPTNGEAFSGKVLTCYCKSTYDIKSYYVEDFNSSTFYHVGDKVFSNNQIYICKHDYPGGNLTISSNYYDEHQKKNLPYFEVLSC